MLPDSVARFIDKDSFERLSARLRETITSEYLYSKNRSDILQILAELAELSYKTGRSDERYYLAGPQIISMYDERD